MNYKFDLVLYLRENNKVTGKYNEGKSKDSFSVPCVLDVKTGGAHKLVALNNGNGKWIEVGKLNPVDLTKSELNDKILAGKSPGYRGEIDMTLVGGTFKGEVMGFLRTVSGKAEGETLRFWSFLEPYGQKA